MSVLVMIYGQSGTGKSTSLRNFSRDDVAIVNVSGKPLPFRNDLKTKPLHQHYFLRKMAYPISKMISAPMVAKMPHTNSGTNTYYSSFVSIFISACMPLAF